MNQQNKIKETTERDEDFSDVEGSTRAARR